MAAESVFNYFIGGLALLSTLFSMLIYLNTYLPGPRMKVVDDLLMETKGIYQKASAEGLLPPDMAAEAQTRLLQYETLGDDLRAVTYRTLSPIDILLSFFGGHTFKIGGLSSDLMELRGKLVTTSQEERARRMDERLTYEVNEPVVNSASYPMAERNSSEENSDSTIYTADASTSSPDISRAPTLLSAFSVRFLVQWWSEMFSRRKQAPSSAQPQDEQTHLSDIEAYSRSSTLMEEPLPEDSHPPRSWMSLFQWVRDGESREATQATASHSGNCRVHGEPLQVNPDIASMPV